MSGAAVHYDLSGLDAVREKVMQLGNFDRRPLLDTIGALAISQTQHRIQDEKESPAGVPWPKWSERYKKTRHGNQSLLISEKQGAPGLLKTITANVLSDQSVEVGSNLVYAATHQYGDPKRYIPQRQYLGLSKQNEEDMAETINDWLDQKLKALAA